MTATSTKKNRAGVGATKYVLWRRDDIFIQYYRIRVRSAGALLRSQTTALKNFAFSPTVVGRCRGGSVRRPPPLANGCRQHGGGTTGARTRFAFLLQTPRPEHRRARPRTHCSRPTPPFRHHSRSRSRLAFCSPSAPARHEPSKRHRNRNPDDTRTMGDRLKNVFLFALLVAVAAEEPHADTSTLTTKVSTSSAVVSTASPLPTPSNGMASNKSSSDPVNLNSPNQAQSIQDNSSLVHISLYYEGACSDTRKFIEKQLLPTYSKLGDKFMNVEYVPFAQGEIKEENGTTTYNCVRGESECNADRVHACAIAKVTDQEKLLKFINCSMVAMSTNNTIPINECGQNCKIDQSIIESINTCKTGEEANTLLKKYKSMTTNVDVHYVPKIVVNKDASADIQKLAENNLLKTVCDKIPAESRPAECNSSGSGSSTVIVGILPILISVYYIIRIF